MGNSLVIDLRHFLNEDGSLAEMPRSTLRLLNYFGKGGYKSEKGCSYYWHSMS